MSRFGPSTPEPTSKPSTLATAVHPHVQRDGRSSQAPPKTAPSLVMINSSSWLETVSQDGKVLPAVVEGCDRRQGGPIPEKRHHHPRRPGGFDHTDSDGRYRGHRQNEHGDGQDPPCCLRRLDGQAAGKSCPSRVLAVDVSTAMASRSPAPPWRAAHHTLEVREFQSVWHEADVVLLVRLPTRRSSAHLPGWCPRALSPSGESANSPSFLL